MFYPSNMGDFDEEHIVGSFRGFQDSRTWFTVKLQTPDQITSDLFQFGPTKFRKFEEKVET